MVANNTKRIPVSPRPINAANPAFVIDWRQSPYFAPQDLGDGTATLGNSDGSGFLDYSRIPGMGGLGMSDAASGGGSSALTDYLTSNGLRVYDEPLGGNWVRRGFVDASGNFVGQPQTMEMDDDRAFWNAAMLATAVTGANIGLAAGAGGVAGGTSGVAEGAISGGLSGGGVGAGGLTGTQAAALGSGGAASLVAPNAGSGAGLVAPGAAATPGAVSVGGAGTTGYSLGGTVGGATAGGLTSTQLAALQTGGGLLSNYMQGQAAKDASAAQVEAANRGQQTQLQMFERVRELLQPFVSTGTNALGQLGGLAGLNGPDAQRAAIDAIRAGPEFTALLNQGEERILANAAATGGLRGGNTQAALAQFAPALLAQQIETQFGRLGGITSLGQNAAAGVGNAGITTGQGVANLQQQAGAATAGGLLAQGRTNAGYWGAISNGLGLYAGLNGW